MTFVSVLDSPVGRLRIVSDGQAVIAIGRSEEAAGRPDAVSGEMKRQLAEYFRKERTAFTVPVKLSGTPFQKKVWHALQAVPYGSTVSYRDLARMAGYRRGWQAVGQAMSKSGLMIVVPAHRVIAADGSLGGWGDPADLAVKEYLLRLEGGWGLRDKE